MIDANGEYLYGDSTPAPMTTDFIGFLRAFIDFAVEALAREATATEATQESAHLRDATEKRVVDAEALAFQVSCVLDHARREGVDPLLARSAVKIGNATWEVVHAETEAARAEAAAVAARAARTKEQARTACENALGTLVLRTDVPDAVAIVRMSVGGDGQYDAQVTARTSYGLSWSFPVEIPSSHAFARVLRVDRVVQRIEVHIPDETGWPIKAPKVRTHRRDRLYLTELALAPAEAFMGLRSAPDGTGEGCNVWLHREAQAVRVEWIQTEGRTPDSACDVDGEEGDKLRSLHAELAALVAEIAQSKRPPVSVKMDDTPIHEHETAAIIERLIANIAPQVAEIARRSRAPGELVLRRRLDDNRREEVFLSKGDLLKKIAQLPAALRGAFAPLDLWDGAALSHNGEGNPVARGVEPPSVEETQEDELLTVIVAEGLANGAVMPP
jgi:hypothetical protein